MCHIQLATIKNYAETVSVSTVSFVFESDFNITFFYLHIGEYVVVISYYYDFICYFLVLSD